MSLFYAHVSQLVREWVAVQEQNPQMQARLPPPSQLLPPSPPIGTPVVSPDSLVSPSTPTDFQLQSEYTLPFHVFHFPHNKYLCYSYTNGPPSLCLPGHKQSRI
ncbi:hypothetical protein Pelo_5912 [Pelomyxa schiedti]|nr:hypothetical protein Pelo_5912 [Pelomyxa schiedti]